MEMNIPDRTIVHNKVHNDERFWKEKITPVELGI